LKKTAATLLRDIRLSAPQTLAILYPWKFQREYKNKTAAIPLRDIRLPAPAGQRYGIKPPCARFLFVSYGSARFCFASFSLTKIWCFVAANENKKSAFRRTFCSMFFRLFLLVFGVFRFGISRIGARCASARRAAPAVARGFSLFFAHYRAYHGSDDNQACRDDDYDFNCAHNAPPINIF